MQPLPLGRSLATICDVAAARAATPRASRPLILGINPGSCWIAVNPGGGGMVDVPESTDVVVPVVAVSVSVDVEVTVELCVPMKWLVLVLI